MLGDFGKLVRRINMNMTRYIGKHLDKDGIKYGQIDYFLLIFNNPGINQLELAKASNVGKASVTKAIKILEDQEFIIRKTDENDRRNVKCFVTEKGKEHISELMILKSGVEKDLFKGFSKEELELFYSFMTRLKENSDDLD